MSASKKADQQFSVDIYKVTICTLQSYHFLSHNLIAAPKINLEEYEYLYKSNLARLH